MSELKPYIGQHPIDLTLTDYYLKSEADKVIAEKNAEIAELRMNRCDQCQQEICQIDTKIAELEDKLRAANEQIENLINSASNIMLFQDRVLAKKSNEAR